MNVPFPSESQCLRIRKISQFYRLSFHRNLQKSSSAILKIDQSDAHAVGPAISDLNLLLFNFTGISVHGLHVCFNISFKSRFLEP